MKFKAAVLTKLNSDLEIEYIENLPLETGQVLVKILKSGICGAQLHEIAGNKGNAKFLPHLLGHEGLGVVSEIGPGVKKVSVGDKVVLHWRVSEGIESEFPKYRFRDKIITSGKVTTFSEYSVVSENRITKVCNDIDPNLGVLLGCGLTTAFGVVSNEAKIKIGESVLVLGCGGVGLLLIKALRLASAFPIVGIDRVQDKVKEFVDEVYGDLDSLKGRKFDCILDTTGNSNLISESLKLLSNGGRLIFVGQPSGESTLSNWGSLFGQSKSNSVIFSQGGSTVPQDDIPRYIKLHDSNKFSVSNVVTHEFDFLKINEAIGTLRSGIAGRVVINMV